MKADKQFLLIPAMPTPNGALHLGHIGAQFLKLDILNRHYNSLGYTSTYLCGLDVYDNAISIEAEKNGVSEDEICNDNHKAIEADLALFNIQPDNIINWRDAKWHPIWQKTLEDVDRRLKSHKKLVDEEIPFRENTNEAITGRWLQAECPACNKPIHGFSCDPCSLEFSPREVKNPQSKKGFKLTWQTVSNEFVETPTSTLREYYQSLSLPSQSIKLANTILGEKPSYLARWTTYDKCGIPTTHPGQVYYHYAFSILEAVAFGDFVKTKFNLSFNAFDPESDVTTIIAYGRDCSNAFLVSIPILMFAAGLKPYDLQMVSPFYLMENQKMSTNRKFAIWVQQLKQLKNFSSDNARAFMASIAQPDTEPNIELHQIEEFFEKHERVVGQPLAHLLKTIEASNSYVEQLDLSIINLALNTYDQIASHLQPENLNLPFVYNIILDYVSQISEGATTAEKRQTLALCTAVILHPLLPDISQKLWRSLKLAGSPSCTFLLSINKKIGQAI